MVRNGDFSQAMEMANVDGEAEQGMIDAPSQFGVAAHRVDEHAGFRLEGQSHGPRFGMTAQPEAAVHQQVEMFVR